jgi:hypothetical protein
MAFDLDQNRQFKFEIYFSTNYQVNVYPDLAAFIVLGPAIKLKFSARLALQSIFDERANGANSFETIIHDDCPL